MKDKRTSHSLLTCNPTRRHLAFLTVELFSDLKSDSNSHFFISSLRHFWIKMSVQDHFSSFRSSLSFPSTWTYVRCFVLLFYINKKKTKIDWLFLLLYLLQRFLWRKHVFMQTGLWLWQMWVSSQKKGKGLEETVRKQVTLRTFRRRPPLLKPHLGKSVGVSQLWCLRSFPSGCSDLHELHHFFSALFSLFTFKCCFRKPLRHDTQVISWKYINITKLKKNNICIHELFWSQTFKPLNIMSPQTVMCLLTSSRLSESLARGQSCIHVDDNVRSNTSTICSKMVSSSLQMSINEWPILPVRWAENLFFSSVVFIILTGCDITKHICFGKWAGPESLSVIGQLLRHFGSEDLIKCSWV